MDIVSHKMPDEIEDGYFEWLCSYDMVSPFLRPDFLQVDPSSAKILHVGCGRSRVPQQMCMEFGYRPDLTCCTDNDQAVVDEMSNMFGSISINDNPQDDTSGTSQFNSAPQLNNVSKLNYRVADINNCRSEFASCMFDLIIDKGAFDAIICEPNCTMFFEIYRLLAPGGIYVLISLREPELMKSLLNCGLPWEINYDEKHSIAGANAQNANNPIPVFLVRKPKEAPREPTMSPAEVLEHMNRATDYYFQQLNPFVTIELRRRIEEACRGAPPEGIRYQHMYNIMYEPEVKQEYPFELFLCDVQQFMEDVKKDRRRINFGDKMTAELALEFLEWAS